MSDLFPLRTPASFSQDFPQIAFIIEQLLNQTITIVPVRVVSVRNSGSLASDCYVTVQPLLNQMQASGRGVPHGEIDNVPCFRLRAGAAAVILDPVAGDVGLMAVAYRDSSSLVAQDQGSAGSLQGSSTTYNPGSNAKYDWGSGFYLGGCLNGAVSAYIQLTADLCKIVAPTINLNGVTIDSSGNIAGAKDLNASGTITGQTDVVAGGVSGKTHVHSGVTTGSGDSGPPA